VFKRHWLRLRLSVEMIQHSTPNDAFEKIGKNVDLEEHHKITIYSEKAQLDNFLKFITDFLIPFKNEAFENQKLKRQNCLFFTKLYVGCASILKWTIPSNQKGRVLSFNQYLFEEIKFFELENVEKCQETYDTLVADLLCLQELIEQDESLSIDGELA